MADRKRRRLGLRFRLGAGEAIAGFSAAILFVLLFSTWYEFEYTGAFLMLLLVPGENAWESLELIAPLLALVSVVTAGLVFTRLLKPGWRPLIAPGAAIAVLGALAFLLVLYRALVLPDYGELESVQIEVTRSLAVFLSLAAALGIAVGGYRAMREAGSSFAAVADALQPRRGRPASRKR